MRQLTLNIRENKFHAFLEFIKTLDYVEIPEAEKKALKEFQDSLNQVKMIQEGKIEKQSVEDFLNEL
jgi:cystathionine beta-lyase family protein involved in aluminum resistance